MGALKQLLNSLDAQISDVEANAPNNIHLFPDFTPERFAEQTQVFCDELFTAQSMEEAYQKFTLVIMAGKMANLSHGVIFNMMTKSLNDAEVKVLDARKGAARRKIVEHMAQRVKYHGQRIQSGLEPMPDVDLPEPLVPVGFPLLKKPGGPKLH